MKERLCYELYTRAPKGSKQPELSRRLSSQGASQNGDDQSRNFGRYQSIVSSPSNCLQMKWCFSLLSPCIWAVGPSRPSLVRGLRPRNAPPNNIRRRPGVDIRNRCLIERVQPDHVPPVPSDPRMCRPVACPRTLPKAGKQPQPPPALIPRQTGPPPNLRCTLRANPLDDEHKT